MSKDNFIQLMQAAAEDDQLTAELQNAQNFDEVKAVAQRRGFDLGDLDAQQARQAIGSLGQDDGEMADAELASVAGGILAKLQDGATIFKADKRPAGHPDGIIVRDGKPVI